jgi:hypothetical protein
VSSAPSAWHQCSPWPRSGTQRQGRNKAWQHNPSRLARQGDYRSIRRRTLPSSWHGGGVNSWRHTQIRGQKEKQALLPCSELQIPFFTLAHFQSNPETAPSP